MKNLKLNNRQAKAIETKAKIYDSADQLFRTYGFDHVSVDSIVEKAGVSKGSFYVHFDSKNSLISALATDFVARLDLDYKSFLESFPPNAMASEILLSIVGKIVDVLTLTIGYNSMKIIYEALITRTINTDPIVGYDRELYKMFNEIIKKGIDQQEFQTEMTIDTITKHCIMAIRGITYEWCIRYPDFDLKSEVLIHFKILLNGLKKQ